VNEYYAVGFSGKATGAPDSLVMCELWESTQCLNTVTTTITENAYTAAADVTAKITALGTAPAGTTWTAITCTALCTATASGGGANGIACPTTFAGSFCLQRKVVGTTHVA